MSTRAKHNLKGILHPYLFVLKEGGGIKSDYLDYSLMMLLINSSETIKSPYKEKTKLSDIVQDMDIMASSLPACLTRSEDSGSKKS